MTDEDVVRYRTEGPVAIVTMHRPQYGNAQNSAMTYALDDALYRAADDDEVKVIVLTGRGSTSPPGTTSAPPAGTSTPRFRAAPGSGGTTSANPARRAVSPASPRCTWACAGAGGSCRSRPSPRSRAPASRVG
ncbi:hypothetical protein GCM10027610_048660 [Dactylosporangium cerinum]